MRLGAGGGRHDFGRDARRGDAGNLLLALLDGSLDDRLVDHRRQLAGQRVGDRRLHRVDDVVIDLDDRLLAFLELLLGVRRRDCDKVDLLLAKLLPGTFRVRGDGRDVQPIAAKLLVEARVVRQGRVLGHDDDHLQRLATDVPESE